MIYPSSKRSGAFVRNECGGVEHKSQIFMRPILSLDLVIIISMIQESKGKTMDVDNILQHLKNAADQNQPRREFELKNFEQLDNVDQAIYIFELLSDHQSYFLENYDEIVESWSGDLSLPILNASNVGSDCLFVGWSVGDVKRSIVTHCTERSPKEEMLHLSAWFSGQYTITVIEYDCSTDTLQKLHELICYERRPILGYPGILSDKTFWVKNDIREVKLSELDPPNGKEYIVPLVLGTANDIGVVCLDLHDYPHLFVGGVLGSGKTELLKSIIEGLKKYNENEQVELIVGCEEELDYLYLEPLELLRWPIFTGVQMINEQLRWLLEEASKREKELIHESEKPLANRERRRVDLPRIVFVIDELQCSEPYKTKIEQQLLRLLSKPKEIGIHVILSSRRLSGKEIDSKVVDSFPVKIAMITETPEQSYFVLGQSGAEQLKGWGDALVSLPNSSKPFRMQVARSEFTL